MEASDLTILLILEVIMAKVLVTGGAGFIGSNLVDALIKKNHEVAVVDNLSTGRQENLNPQAHFYKIDITDQEPLSEVFAKEKPEIIFHLGAQASVNTSVENPALDISVNVIGTVNLLELCRQHNIKKIIFSSTGGAIYGDQAPRPTNETAEQLPATPYGMDKLAAEKYINFYQNNYDLKPVILRYANVYGPRQNPHGEAGVIAIFTDRMLKNTPYNLYGDGEQTRDFVFVGDVVRANLAALEYNKTGIFNIGSGRETSVNQVIELLQKYSGSSLPPTKMPAKLEQRNSCLDSSLAQEKLNWQPSADIEEGLKKTIEFYKNSLK